MSGWRYWLLVAGAGGVLGVVSVVAPFGGGDEPTPAGLTETTRVEQLKELERLRLQGIREATAGEYDKGIATFLRLAYVNPHDPFAFQRMGAVMEEMGEERFVASLTAAYAGRPDGDTMERTLAAVALAVGKNEAAARRAKRRLSDHPDDVAAQYLLGAALRRRGDAAGALPPLTAVVAAAPTHYYAYLELQQAYEALGDEGMANKMLGLALNNSPANREGVCCGLPPDPKAASGA